MALQPFLLQVTGSSGHSANSHQVPNQSQAESGQGGAAPALPEERVCFGSKARRDRLREPGSECQELWSPFSDEETGTWKARLTCSRSHISLCGRRDNHGIPRSQRRKQQLVCVVLG